MRRIAALNPWREIPSTAVSSTSSSERARSSSLATPASASESRFISHSAFASSTT